MIIFSTQEFGFVELPEAYSTAAAPCRRKKIRTCWSWCGANGRVIGSATALLVTMKGLPLLTTKFAGDARTAVRCGGHGIAIVAWWPVYESVEFDHARMNDAAQSGFMNLGGRNLSGDRGVPSRLAHEQIGKAVKLCLEKSVSLAICGSTS